MNTSYDKIEEICRNSNGYSQYFRYGGLGYKYSVAHWLRSSCEVSIAAVEPGRIEDVQAIMEVIASDPTLKFAIKGGGHATNPKFSSVEDGLQISMIRFNELTYDESSQTITIGSGCLWDEVYRYLNPLKRTVVGGAGAAGVGVAGWLLGGGYSLRTNQHGLGVDNIVKIGVVVPSGDYRLVTKDSNQELFIALRGGGNKFGIVTHFVLRTFPETGVYGGVLSYNEDTTPLAMKAISNFIERSKNPSTKDLKSAIVGAFRYTRVQGQVRYEFTVQCFYGAPQIVEPNPFQGFLDISPRGGSLSSTNYVALDTQFSFLHIAIPPAIETIQSSLGAKYPAMEGIAELNHRGRWGCVMVSNFTLDFMERIQKEAKRLSGLMDLHGGLRVVLDIWPFDDGIFKYGSDTAWPPNGNRQLPPVFPMIVICYWEDEAKDAFWLKEMNDTINILRAAAVNTGVSYENASVYCNTTLETTSPQDIYRGGLNLLADIRKQIDQSGVMDRTGGFNIPLPTTNNIRDILERLGMDDKESEKLRKLLKLLLILLNA